MTQSLGAERAALIAVSAAIASRDDAALDLALRSAREVPGLGYIAVDEVILQAHLFVGFPIALEALGRWRRIGGGPDVDAEVSRRPAAHADGAADLADPDGAVRDHHAERGARVCATVYGTNYARLRENVQNLHPDVDRWMVEGGYGRVIGRPGLDLATRELCIAALLAVWDTPRQLHSHMRGALNVGATADDVRAALDIALEYSTSAAGARARELYDRITG